MKKFILILNVFIAFLLSKTLVVDDDYGGWGGSICEHGSKKNMWSYYDYSNIKDALNDATDGDKIRICPGKYEEDNLEISQNNFIIESTTNNKNDVNITNENISSQKNIFRMPNYIENFLLKGVSLYQYSTTHSGIYSKTYIKNIVLDNLYIYSKGRGVYESNSLENFVIKNSDIVSNKQSVYLKGINNNISFIDIYFKSIGSYATIKTTNWGNVRLYTDVRVSNKLESGKYGVNIEQGEVSIKNSDFVTNDIAIYLRQNFGKISIINNNIQSDKRGIYSPNELDDDTNISKNKIVLNNNNEGVYLKKAVGKLYFTNNDIEGGSYGLRILDSSNGGDIKNNTIKNVSTKGLYLLSTEKWRSFQVINNCFENGSGKNIESKDTNGYFNENYYDDWSGTGDYTIPTIPKYDTNPWIQCNVENNESNVTAEVFLNYRMDECEWRGVNGEVKDYSGNNYNATAKNGSNTESNETLNGMIGRVGDFRDGDYSLLTDVLLPQIYTITMWVKFPLDETNHKDFSGKKYFNIADVPKSDKDYIYFKNDNNNWSLCMFGSTYECKSYNPQNLSGWHFLTFKVSDNGTQFYLDNDLKLNFNQHPNNVKLGLIFNSDYDDSSNSDNNPNKQSLGAYVDEFKIFKGLVSPIDLTTIYENELNRKNYDGGNREDIDCKTYQTCYLTHFSSQSEIDQNWTIIKQENYTPQVVNQKLRLTTNSGNIATGLTLANKVFKANGTKFKIRFKHYAYDGSSAKGADGIGIVFSDASITPVAGAFGGSLGYAQRDTPSNEDGFAGGWIGIGIDEYGNYSNPTEGRVGGPGFTEQAVAIRGSYLENYKYLVGTQTLNPAVSDGNSNTPSPGYEYEIDVDTTQTNKTIISVYRNTGSGDNILIDNYEYNSTNTPDYFKFSITGSTGGENNIHEISDLEISALDCNATLVAPPPQYSFDAKEINRADKNITTKIVNKEFSLEVFSDKNFTGTVCSSVVDSSDNNLSSWFKNYFNNKNNSSQTTQGNPKYKVGVANRNSRIKIEWINNQDTTCPLNENNGSSDSTDNFAIRPKKFKIINTSSHIFAGGNFDLTFEALDENDNDTKNYNETNSFDVNVSELKNGCKTGNFEVNVSFSNGRSDSIAKYDEVGDINLSIIDKGFADVDVNDTPVTDRIILPAFINITSYPYNGKTITTFSNQNIIYIDKNLSNFAEVNTTIKLLNKQNQVVQNFDKNCYADDVNISYDVANNIIDSFTGIYNINQIDENDSKFQKWNNKFEINSSLFKKGEANISIKFNIYKNRAYPVSIVDLNFTKTILDYDKASIHNIENINKNFSFYYLELFTDDITTSEIQSSAKVYILVYDRNRNHFSNEKLLYWFLDTNYNEDNVKILGYTTSYKYDLNVTNFNVDLNKTGYDYNLSVNNPDKIHFVIIHYKTPLYLWYSKYKDYNDSLNSYCTTHYCTEYLFNGQTIINKDVGSGDFKGSAVKIITPKRKRFGLKIYR